MTGYSDFLVFVDESGDHGLECVDAQYPVFVLAFCIIRKKDYIWQLTPAMQEVKCRHFGHDNIILHERDIRKDIGDFTSLRPREKKQAFMDDLTHVIANRLLVVRCGIDELEIVLFADCFQGSNTDAWSRDIYAGFGLNAAVGSCIATPGYRSSTA